MSTENEQFGRGDGQEQNIISIPKREFRKIQQYAQVQEISLQEAAIHFMRKGAPVLEGINKGLKEQAKKRKRTTLQNKRNRGLQNRQ
jgi:hypothetical protein